MGMFSFLMRPSDAQARIFYWTTLAFGVCEIISGEEEARLIHLAVAQAVNLKGKHAVLIDIGGGSVEVTIAEGQKVISTESYNMGTVRLLQKLDEGDHPSGEVDAPPKRPFNLLVREYAEAARQRIDREIGDARVDVCVGTGGNANWSSRVRSRRSPPARIDGAGWVWVFDPGAGATEPEAEL